MNACWVIAAALAIGQSPVDVKPLFGPAVSGEFVALSAEELVVRTPEGEQKLPVKSVLRISFPKPETGPPETGPTATSPAVWVELHDGSSVTGASYAVVGGQATISLIGGAEASISTRVIRYVRLKSHDGDVELAKQWAGILAQTATEDVLVIRKKTALPAADPGGEEKTVLSLDYLGGMLGDVSEAAVTFEFDGEKKNVRRDKVEGMIYYRGAGEAIPAARCRIADRLGNVWNAQTAAVADGKLQLVTAAGASQELPLESIDSLDFSAGKVVYLSDLKPESSEWTPFFDSSKTPSAAIFYRPRFDEALGGQPLRIGDVTFEKGVYMRSRTRITWRLPGTFRKLLATAGIDYGADENGGKSGDVQLVILGDDKPLFDKPIRGSDGAVDLDLDLTGVKRLTVLVDYGGNIDIADFLDLADARVTK